MLPILFASEGAGEVDSALVTPCSCEVPDDDDEKRLRVCSCALRSSSTFWLTGLDEVWRYAEGEYRRHSYSL